MPIGQARRRPGRLVHRHPDEPRVRDDSCGEVAKGLAVDRKTNPQIAAELFVSQKTVETHLRNIFHKMDVTTRAALARAVERTDPTALSRPS
jgi:DNA-binding CsgD family transcriptional regulator